MKILTCAGARPNFMKVAPLLREMRRHPDVTSILVHTGQHYDPALSDVFFQELDIPKPDYNLGIGSLSREEQIAKISEAFEPIVQKEKPDTIIVVGDVNSTVACAQAGKKYGVKIAHVEAGLRSFDLDMPEEHNRVQTDHLSDLLFVTEEDGMHNLAREKCSGRAYLVGNVMIDTLVFSLPQIDRSTIVEDLKLRKGKYLTATFHRPSNVDTEDNARKLVITLLGVAALTPVVLPLHPRTKAALTKFGLFDQLLRAPQLLLIDPLGYFDFLALVKNSLGVATDSGGIQEETTYLGIPCLTVRANTERPATILQGTNVLVGHDHNMLFSELKKLLNDESRRESTCPPLWDGCAAERIINILLTETTNLEKTWITKSAQPFVEVAGVEVPVLGSTITDPNQGTSLKSS